MKKAKKGYEYKCPHGKRTTKISNEGFDKSRDVPASYCKNNCGLYMNGCKKFKF